jgi:hypothetical protein
LAGANRYSKKSSRVGLSGMRGRRGSGPILKDTTATRQQEALGVLGVKLIHGAYVRHGEPQALIGPLLDERLMSLRLVERGRFRTLTKLTLDLLGERGSSSSRSRWS